MHVGAAEPERAHSADAAALDWLPGDFRRGTLEWKIGPRNMRTWRVEMQMRRNCSMLQRKDDLDETGHTCRSFEMTDIGLNRSNDQRSGPDRGRRRIRHRGRIDLQRIAELRTRSVRLDIADLAGRDTCAGSALLADDRLLRRTIGRSEATAWPVLVDGATADQSEDPISVGLRIAEALEHDDAAPFGARKSIGCGIETSCSVRRAPASANATGR